MRAREKTNRSRLIAAIREIQRETAETRAGRAAQTLRACEQERAHCESECRETEAGWAQALSQPSLSLDIAALWSSALSRREVTLAQAASDVARARAAAESSARELHAALVRVDAARELARQARKDEQRQRDDNALQAVLDRHAHRRNAR